jgi:hypothetical protein
VLEKYADQLALLITYVMNSAFSGVTSSSILACTERVPAYLQVDYHQTRTNKKISLFFFPKTWVQT